MKEKFSNYFNYIKKNKIELDNVLFSIANHKDYYNSIVHEEMKKDEYIDSLVKYKNSKNLGESLKFLFDCSELLEKYVFEKGEDKNIVPNQIFNDFINLNNKLVQGND